MPAKATKKNRIPAQAVVPVTAPVAVPFVQQMPVEIRCPQCDGFGKVDSDEKKGWMRYLTDRTFHNKIIRGEVSPLPCPTCRGVGRTTHTPTN
jgi:DnaJ-class molecular chaperone